MEAAEGLQANHLKEERQAAELANRYGLELVDMDRFRIDNDLLRSIPFDVMLRYNFVPEAQRDGRLIIVMVDPGNITRLDELELLLGRPVEVKLGRRSAIEEILKRSEGAQRVLDEASEDFRLQLVQEDADG
jgi:type IV pilus assembly protein PilB